MNTSKISVIIPAYNVEGYVKQCLLSITNQTYKNIEIIVVDDGSLDKTASQIELVASSDSRIRFYKKKNSGVSDTRNFGLERATGDYIVFVDADDYLDSLFIEHLYNSIKRNGTDFAFYSRCFRHKKDHQPKTFVENKLSAEETLIKLLSPDIVVGCWNKIYKKELLDKNNIRFNSDLFYGEGLNFITAYSQHINSASMLFERRYYYRKNNQTSATTAFNLKKYVNGEKSLETIYSNLIIKTDPVEKAYNFHMCMFYLTSFLDILKNRCKKQNIDLYKKWRNGFLKLSKKAITYDKVSIKRKLIVLTGVLCPHFLAFLDKKRKEKESRESF